ncbi:bifunctional phosphoribosylaminoimidazolecarboxamide formyltransferase/IMP cyclohydrolase [Gloeobacter morelensis]|uniref:Bifunctional purine biosynthesis protein PurH n=1 Tax=Gloeobacter morelensis MG652769 TaxID=2781736 RepID=A0ABY3PI96_9CYAN|nr:bifunctional phosphoribosylaminoimidazolecarboxamide formyltransferase/IMP cyclohydrolase [Gloeobacter morelensis]UFP93401.1 bifunctional phosphoribosylaminoimidazolecarboxamide formyltransferase/IMP cyclohydrolase [Gloeobacter morelensis MG652769]
MPIALLSVSDKTGLVDFARALVTEFEYQLVSSGGTARALAEAGIPVQEVGDFTGAAEILGGRVKTLHPKIHGGILARRDQESDRRDLQTHSIAPIDLVVVNLYPFEQDPRIEQIDVGGPTMVRAAAKNHAFVTVLVFVGQYEGCLAELRRNRGVTTLPFRAACAAAAFARTAAYDRAIAAWFAGAEPVLGERLGLELERMQPLRYGENPHQVAAWYRHGPPTGWSTGRILQGKALSFNNLIDLEASRRLVAEFDDTPAAVIIKHTNPCGVAADATIAEAYRRAFEADSVSAFGGIVALNRPCDAPSAELLSQTFLECIVAPAFTAEALALLERKKNLRLLELADLTTPPVFDIKPISGGFLIQQVDPPVRAEDWKVVTEAVPDNAQMAELVFAWKVCKHVKSNAIVVSRLHQTLGVGAGQMNRVGSAQLALAQAGEKARGAILASDGFFPFDDTVRAAAERGIRAIVQPGGSLRDEDSIRACNELGVAMVITGVRHFLH